MIVKFSKLCPEAIVPTKAKYGDAGFDLTAISCQYVSDAEVPYYNYEFGLAVEIPQGYFGLLCPRSSISKKALMLSNSLGVIDAGYRGPLSARFKVTNYQGEHTKVYEVGDRVVQLIIIPIPEISLVEVPYENLSKTYRGNGSFGSSGR